MGTDWLVPLGFIVCFLMAMCMGANDVANAFGTSVGSGVITMRQAFCIAAVMNVLGAVSMSGAVTQTIRKGIVDLKKFAPSGEGDVGKPEELQLLMLCAMIGTVSYVTLATIKAMPVSTTQAVLGGIVGAMLAFNGPSGVLWVSEGGVCEYSRETSRFSCGGVVGIVLQWFFAPLISMAFAMILFLVSSKLLLTVEPALALKRAPPMMAFAVGAISFALAWFIVVQQQHHPHTRGWDPRDVADPVNHATALEVLFCILIGVTTAYLTLTVFSVYPEVLTFTPADYAMGRTGVAEAAVADAYAAVDEPGAREERRIEAEAARSVEMVSAKSPMVDDDSPSTFHSAFEDQDAEAAMDHISLDEPPPRNTSSAAVRDSAPGPDQIEIFTGEIHDDTRAAHASARTYDPAVEKVFGSAQICSAALSAFAAGANDIANEVAPIAAIWQTQRQGFVAANVRTPRWLYAYAGLGVAVGLAMFGKRVMRTVGRDCTKITPSRGFNIELGYSLASLISSAEGWPVSTTQLCIGAVVGVALVSGEDVSKSLNRKLLFTIFCSWVLTPFMSGIISAICFACLRPALGAP
mmetsp:Transcript_13384/g.46596  ORF Transcript_13384/g.46596 Transcript_13384/m.46596 type:complete len:578 (+) Transcript_13384:69-1802(+)